MTLPTTKKRFDLTSWLDSVDSFFDQPSFFQRFRNGHQVLPAVNVAEEDGRYLVEVAAPGMKKKDFQVEVKHGQLVISATSREEKEEIEEDRFTRREFSYQSFERSFHLPENVNADAIKARYEDGVLKLEIPKTEVEEAKKALHIPIA